jgi:hypothetical protein
MCKRFEQSLTCGRDRKEVSFGNLVGEIGSGRGEVRDICKSRSKDVQGLTDLIRNLNFS